MNIHSVSSYLQRFDAPPAPAPQPPESLTLLDDLFLFPLEARHEEAAFDPVPPEAPVDVEALRRAFDEELAVALATQQAAHEEDLRLARAQWVGEQGALLAARLSESLAVALDGLRSDVARILAPFVADEIQQKALDELTASIRRAVAGEDAAAIRLEGPKDVIDKIAEAFAQEQAAVNLFESDAVDVTVDFGLTRIETRLAAWMSRLGDSGSHSS